jgi:hypothetical protein
MEPRYAQKYIQEFIRILAPQGLLLFQIPSHPVTLRYRLKESLPTPLRDGLYFLKYRGQPRLEIHGIRQEKMIKLLEGNGIEIIDIRPDKGAYRHWASFRYCGVKTG